MKISILVKIYENLDFGQNCRKIMILVTIFGKSRFWSRFSGKSIWVKIFPKSSSWSKFQINVDLGQNLQICRFGSILFFFLKISILLKVVEKSQIW